MTLDATLTPVRYFTPFDPYFYTVDNRPLTDLAARDDEIATAVQTIIDGGGGGGGGGGSSTTISGFLTTDSVVLSADSAGLVSSFATATGTFRVFSNTTENTGSSVSYSVISQTACTVSIASSGVYSASAMSADTASATLQAVFGGVTLTKTFTLSKSKTGASASTFQGFLTLDSATVPADSSGVVSSFSTATGTFKVFNGLTDVTTSASFSQSGAVGCTATINGTTGVYSISAMSANQGSVTFTAIYSGMTLTKIFSISKAIAGAAGSGANPITGFLTADSVTVAALSDGTVGDLSTATGTFEVFNNNTRVMSGVTYSVATASGCSVSINSSGVYTTISVSANSATATFTAVYGGVTLTKTFTISKAIAGSSGANGSQGIRGTILTSISGGWNSTTAAAQIASIATAAGSSPTHPIAGDIVYYTGGASQCTVSGNPGTWSGVAAYIDGSLVVNGTIGGAKLIAGSVSTDRLSAGLNSIASGMNFGLGCNTAWQGTTAAGYFEVNNSNWALQAVSTSSSVGAAFGALTLNQAGGNYGGYFACSVDQALTNKKTEVSLTDLNSAALFVYFVANDPSKILNIATSTYALSSTSGKGGAYLPDGYHPFTGLHDAMLPKTSTAVIGDILVDVELALKIDVSNTIFKVDASTSAGQSGTIGVVSSILPIIPNITAMTATGSEITIMNGLPSELQTTENISTYNLVYMNALGEGQINVCNEGGDISRGDLICTSSIPGKGMKQSDNIIRSNTVAKSRESVTFSGPTEIKLIACIYLCG